MPSIKISMEEDALYERQLRLLYRRSDNLEIQRMKIVRKAIFKLKKREKFLDIGAGNGILTEKLSHYFKETYCLEPNNASYQILKENQCFKIVYNSGIEDFTIDEKFDLILCSHVLYYIKMEYWLDVVEKMYRFLDDGGVIVILLQSKEGEFQTFFNLFASEIYNINPTELHNNLSQNNYDSKILRFKVSFRTDNFEEFLEIIYFLLLEPKENLLKVEEKIKEYINSHFKQNSYFLMTQDINMILVFK